jgi:hypothetical protein
MYQMTITLNGTPSNHATRYRMYPPLAHEQETVRGLGIAIDR